jgi:hypothetical protein
MDFTSSPRLFHLLVAPLLALLPKAVVTHRSDWRCHKFTATHHVLLSLFAQLAHVPSANALLEELNEMDGAGHERNLRELVGFNRLEWDEPVSLNQSSFSRANANRSYRLWCYLFHQLWRQAKARVALPQLEGLGQIVAVDGSLFDCLARMSWAVYRSTASKVKGHFFFNLDGLPERLVLTTGVGSEREVLTTNYRAGVTYLLDRGYNDYALFGTLIKARAHFVTRMLKNAVWTTIEHYPLSAPNQAVGVKKDQQIQLGPDHNTVVVRMVTYQKLDGTTMYYLTSRYDVDALMVVRLYDHRWQIERFFAWIKLHLQLGHWYSENENGVLIQLYAALISFLLLKLYSRQTHKVEHRAMRSEFVRYIDRRLFDRLDPFELHSYFGSLNLHSLSSFSSA